jgi:hypothetical protein
LRKYLLLCLVLLPLLGWCYPPEPGHPVQVDISFPLARKKPIGKGDFETLVIPIKRVANLIVIEARVDTLVGNFIFDTGTPFLILNKTYFRNAWNLQGRVTANAANGSYSTVMHTRVERLQINELQFERVQADVSELGHIENSRGVKILGLLGVSLFTEFEVVIDLYNNVMYLHKLDARGEVPEKERVVKTAPMLKAPFTLARNIITLDVNMGGKSLVFCFDTGAETNAISNLAGASVFRQFKVTRRMVMLGTGGAQSEVLFGNILEFEVGSRLFKNMPAIISPLGDLGEAYGRKIDGILGYSFLVKGIITINFVKKELCMYAFDVSQR